LLAKTFQKIDERSNIPASTFFSFIFGGKVRLAMREI
jgi:hypothetical protein